MRAAEQVLFDAGTSVAELMEVAAGGAAEWVRRIAAGRSVSVLCGPGNNGGDGYVIARCLRNAGNTVRVIAPMEPRTDAARAARKHWNAAVETSGKGLRGDVFVDCLFGTGLARPLEPEHALLLRDLSGRHTVSIAVDLPSGVDSDSGALLNERLPAYDVTLALGAWKFSHWSLPARTRMGVKRLVPIGIAAVDGAAQLVGRPRFTAPAVDAHKYTRGLCAIVAGEMSGASILSALAAQHAGAGYVKLVHDTPLSHAPPSIPVWSGEPMDVLSDPRMGAVLVGQGLGTNAAAQERLKAVLGLNLPMVIDADGLRLLEHIQYDRDASTLATPHDGELEALARAFSVIAEGRRNRAQAVAKASGMVVCAKGPDTVIAAPDGRIALAAPAPSWLSVAGSGDVLAGIAASRMASGSDPFTAACEAVWLHGEAARLCGPSFTPEQLAAAVQKALAGCL
jgi:hydroxyethylthiazole kinase-like uncharacterized protein yjeF